MYLGYKPFIYEFFQSSLWDSLTSSSPHNDAITKLPRNFKEKESLENQQLGSSVYFLKTNPK